jgi:hypothetical protein
MRWKLFGMNFVQAIKVTVKDTPQRSTARFSVNGNLSKISACLPNVISQGIFDTVAGGQRG